MQQRCVHQKHGPGRIRLDEGGKLLVAFDDGAIHEVPASSVVRLPDVSHLTTPSDRGPAAVVRAQAVAIRSVQARWGTFSPARVRLLPHQLWVCQRVLGDWPRSWLIADDVGLGKTIEAGLILSALLAAGALRRLLVICPASLVDQWQERLRTMFDIRSIVFASETEKSKTFWQDHNFVIASLQRLRLDRPGRSEETRWERLLDAEPWDVVIVDEAHHLHADEQLGDTLGLRLLKRMRACGRTRNLLLFTGTPHRGKDHGFKSLLGLVGDNIGPASPWRDIAPRLRDLMIRNNKSNCTDMAGNRLFGSVGIETRHFCFTPAEQTFYTAVATFIRGGFAYAKGLSGQDRTQRTLVLIALLKIATSSTAAISAALQRRLARLEKAPIPGTAPQPTGPLEGDPWDDPEQEAAVASDGMWSLLAERTSEINALRDLLQLAHTVTHEERIEQIVAIAKALPEGETLLLFTEYKATQALLVSRLGEVFGPACVAFINGDNRLVGVKHGEGPQRSIELDRNTAAFGFNRGSYRFLVSTEAGGEGIDLHERCARLVHVDMPWNPMRMHQRVGRLNRIGQTRDVHVTVMRNDTSLEGMILGKLYEKLDRIQQTFDAAMADPEDIRGLVLGGLTGTSQLLTDALERWTSAEAAGKASFASWYDGALKQVDDAANPIVAMVQSMFGDVARFEFGQDAAGIPTLELDALRPFLVRAARTAGAQIDEQIAGATATPVTFSLPTPWQNKDFAHFTVTHEARPQTFIFSRNDIEPSSGGPAGKAKGRLVGLGDRAFDAALAWAERLPDQCATVPGLRKELALMLALRSTTAERAALTRVLVGVERESDGTWRPLQDWQLLDRLNTLDPDGHHAAITPDSAANIGPWPTEATSAILANLPALGVTFAEPLVVPFARLLPVP